MDNNKQSNQKPRRKPRPMWLYCKKCDKKLLKRLANGMIEFAYGRDRRNKREEPRVYMKIWGSVEMKCLDDDCDEMNIFTLLPQQKAENSEKSN